MPLVMIICVLIFTVQEIWGIKFTFMYDYE